jgi:hypothetical protein
VRTTTTTSQRSRRKEESVGKGSAPGMLLATEVLLPTVMSTISEICTVILLVMGGGA